MPTFNHESQTAKLELRIMELEDTVTAVIGIVRTMNSMLGTLNEIVAHYADTLGGLMLALPSTSHRIPLWPVETVPVTRCKASCRCAGEHTHADATPTQP